MASSMGMACGSWIQGGYLKGKRRSIGRVCCSSASLTDQYRTLRIQPGASEKEVKKAFRQLALQVGFFFFIMSCWEFLILRFCFFFEWCIDGLLIDDGILGCFCICFSITQMSARGATVGFNFIGSMKLMM